MPEIKNQEALEAVDKALHRITTGEDTYQVLIDLYQTANLRGVISALRKMHEHQDKERGIQEEGGNLGSGTP